MSNTTIALFEQKEVRKIWYDNQWYFSVVDVVFVLTGSINPKDYLKKMKKRNFDLDFYMGTNCPLLEMKGKSDKIRKTICGNTETIFRIIQSIPSSKAEPFKQRLAKIGYERIQEIENPELAQARMKAIYEQKGYPKSWIDKRLRGIAVRQDLTDEWKDRGVKNNVDYAILTNEIVQSAFGMNIKAYKKLKGLDKHNLRDHMTDLELILTMLGEATTTKFHQDRDSQKFNELQKDAKDGGGIASRTRKDIESQSDAPVISDDNYLDLNEKHKIG